MTRTTGYSTGRLPDSDYEFSEKQHRDLVQEVNEEEDVRELAPPSTSNLGNFSTFCFLFFWTNQKALGLVVPQTFNQASGHHTIYQIVKLPFLNL